MWRNVWAVIRREYIQRVRTKSFVFGTIAVPVLLIVMIAVPAALGGGDDERHIAVLDRTGSLAERLAPDLLELGWTVEIVTPEPGIEDRLRDRAELGEISGFLVLDEATLSRGVATLETSERPSAIRTLTLGNAITRAALEDRLQASGDTGLISGGELRVQMLREAPGADPDDDGPVFILAFMGAMVIYMVILIYSVTVMRATLEEKTSRIVEVIVASMEPWQLLLGKIIGVSAVALTQMGIWFGTAALASIAGIPTLMAARPDLTGLVDLQEALPGLGLLCLFFGYFLLGFFMFSGIYAAVGAMCNSEEEANQAQFPVVMMLVGPLMVVMPVLQDPSASWAVGISLFPLFSPIQMWARIVAGGVPAWQIGLSFILMALSVVVIARIAGRIYKVGILMAGKRPTLPELWRWVRAT